MINHIFEGGARSQFAQEGTSLNPHVKKILKILENPKIVINPLLNPHFQVQKELEKTYLAGGFKPSEKY